MTKKYHLATYGCQMNEYDSNMIAQMLEDKGVEETDSPDNADYVIINTCSIREKAEDTAYARISQLKPIKKEKPDMQIAVIGCMAKNKGKDIPTSLNHVDYVLGPDNYGEIEKLFFEEELKKNYEVITDFDEVENYHGKHAKVNSEFSTFVTIQRGCNKRCTYCIVPFVRGNEKYRDTNDILAECQMAVDKGVTEITLLGQTVNSYHFDGNTFASLMHKVSEIEGLKRIRFTSPHPKHFTDDLIWVMKNRENISNYAHLPVQSGSDKILKTMRRQYDRAKFMEIVGKLRDIDPDFAISTDIIVGFVGEDEKDYLDTLSLVEEVRFDSAFMFAYSPREGTKAFDEIELLSEEEKQKRLAHLIEIQNEITLAQTQKMIGKTKEVLVEGPSHRNKNESLTKTECFKKVILSEDDSRLVKPGQYVNVNIDSITGWTLRGSLV